MAEIVFVTGATGLIGQCLVHKLLDLNYTVYVGARNMENAYSIFGSKVHYIRYDSTKDVVLPPKINYIIHAASNANPKLMTEQPVETLLSNIGVVNLLKYAKENNSKLLYVSSCEVYGQGDGNFKEDDYGYIDHLSTRSSYPSGKRVAESLCSAYAKEYNVNAVIARPCHIYGPTAKKDDPRIGSSFMFKAAVGDDIVMKSTGESIRCYCYVEDCVDALITILLKGQPGEAYNIGGEVVFIKELAETVAEIGGVQVKFEIPNENEKKAFNKMSNASVNDDKLRKLGWSNKFTLKQGIEKTVEELRGYN